MKDRLTRNIDAQLRERLSRRQLHLCFWCNAAVPPESRSLEHIVARTNGGFTGTANCVMACKACNNKRAHRCPIAFLAKMAVRLDGREQRLFIESRAKRISKALKEDRPGLIVREVLDILERK